MALSPAALLTGLARSRTAYLKGDREQRAENDEAARQRSLDLFNEYARNRQLAQTDNAQQNAMERQQDQLAAKEVIAARDAEIRGFKAREDARLRQETLNRESGMNQADPTQGWRGANRQAQVGMNTEDNQTAITRQLLQNQGMLAAALARQAGQGADKPIPAATRIRVSNELTKSVSALRDVKDAIAATTGVSNYTGPWDNFRDVTMERFGQQVDPKRATARAMYAKVVTPILTGEFGANLTKLERDYIAPYITDLAKASEARIPIVLGLIARALEQAREEQMYGLDAQGFDTSPYRNMPERPPMGSTPAPARPGKRPLTEMPK